MSTAPIAAADARPLAHHGGPPPGIREAMGSMAGMLGMSADDLDQKLKGGASLSDLAASAGVSRDDAVAALSAALKANAPQGANMTDDRATTLAERLMDGPPKGHHHTDGAGRAQGSASRMADALGGDGDADDIVSRLTAGEDLASIASSSGRSPSDLIQALARGFSVDDRA
ncbi:MAG: hypothetical protein AB7O78_08465 [Thermoleophilia bacterium]